MVTAVLRAGTAATWVGSLSGPPRLVGQPSGCSNWVVGLIPLPKRVTLRPVSLFAARGRRSVLEAPFVRGFGRDRYGCDSLTRKQHGRVSASAEKDESVSDFGTFDLDPSVFDGEDYKSAKESYVHKAGAEVFEGCEELHPVYVRQHVLGNKKINMPDGAVLLLSKEEAPVEGWYVVKKAEKLFAAAFITGVMLLGLGGGPAQAPTVRETASYRRSVGSPDRAATTRRGRNTARNLANQQDEANPLILPGAILACAALAMMLMKNKTSDPKALPDKKKAVPVIKAKKDPWVTALHVHLGVLGTATSLRLDLEDIKCNKEGRLALGDRKSEAKTLKASARALMKNLEHIAFANQQMCHSANMSTARNVICSYEFTDDRRQKNAPTMNMLEDIGINEYKQLIKKVEKPSIDYLKTGYTVVTLTCLIRSRVQLPPVKDTLDLHLLLGRLELVDPKDIEMVSLKWDPRKDETMPEDVMHQYFPDLKLLAREEDLAELEKASAC